MTMIFEHFPATSRWRRLQIVVGDGQVRQCAIGGWHGGVRGCTEEERQEWSKFFPKEPAAGLEGLAWPRVNVQSISPPILLVDHGEKE